MCAAAPGEVTLPCSVVIPLRSLGFSLYIPAAIGRQLFAEAEDASATSPFVKVPLAAEDASGALTALPCLAMPSLALLGQA